MNKIYQGETLNFVFRCKQKCGIPANMENMDISILLKDSFGSVVYQFSTLAIEGAKKIVVEENYVICRLGKEDMSKLSGSFALEVKVTKGDLTMIDIVKGIKIYGSIIGEDVDL